MKVSALAMIGLLLLATASGLPAVLADWCLQGHCPHHGADCSCGDMCVLRGPSPHHRGSPARGCRLRAACGNTGPAAVSAGSAKATPAPPEEELSVRPALSGHSVLISAHRPDGDFPAPPSPPPRNS